MTRGIGVNLGAIQSDPAKLQVLHLPGDAQHLHKQRLDLLEKALPEGAQRFMIQLRIGGDIAKGDRFVGCRLDAPARINACGVAVNEQTTHHTRVIGNRARAAVLPAQRREIELIDDIDDKARQVILGRPLIHRGWQQVCRVSIHRRKSCHSFASSMGAMSMPMNGYPLDSMTRFMTRDMVISMTNRQLSPTGC